MSTKECFKIKEKLQTWIMVAVAQVHKSTKKHRIIRLQRVNIRVCKLDFNKARKCVPALCRGQPSLYHCDFCMCAAKVSPVKLENINKKYIGGIEKITRK